MPARPRVNKASIVRKLGTSRLATQKIRGFIVNEVEDKHRRMKKDLFDEVRRNEVVKELRRETFPVNSNIVPATAKGSNLFSFLGFDAGDTNPVDRLFAVMERLFSEPVVRKIRGEQRYKITVSSPLQQDIEAEKKELYIRQERTYTGRSWPEAVRKGIAGFPRYLFDKTRDFGGASFSGVAIQVKNFMRGGSFMGRPFLGRTLANYRSKWREMRFTRR